MANDYNDLLTQLMISMNSSARGFCLIPRVTPLLISLEYLDLGTYNLLGFRVYYYSVYEFRHISENGPRT